MKTLGFIDAQATGPGTDGGIDAESSEAAAQVKFYANPIGRPDIQRLRGAAHEYRLALFYSMGGYTKEAVAYSDEAGVALFLMDPYGNCQPISELAALLIEPEHVQERKQQLEELQAIRYRYAASTLESDLELFAQFARSVSLSAEESALYLHVASGLELAVRDFRSAIDAKLFAQADVFFGEIRKRTTFLSWTAGSELAKNYADLEEAVSEGWSRDATPGSEYLLQRVGSGVVDLREFLSNSLDVWSESFPSNVDPNDLIDPETLRFAGMLLVVSVDTSLLTPDLLGQLKTSLRRGVERSHLASTAIFDHIMALHLDLGLEYPRGLVAKKLHADSAVDTIYQQLSASDR